MRKSPGGGESTEGGEMQGRGTEGEAAEREARGPGRWLTPPAVCVRG